MKVVRTVLILVAVMLIAQPMFAQRPQRPQREGRPGGRSGSLADRVKMLDDLNLTADQKAKVAALQKEFEAKFQEAAKKMESIYTPEQKAAREAAIKKATADGKTGRELFQAGRAAVTLTEKQKTDLADAMKARGEVDKQWREKITSILTAEQQEQLKKKFEARRRPARSN